MTLRRLAAAVMLGVLALAGLAACRADPAAAAYVGDHKITDAQIAAVVEDYQAGARKRVGDEIDDLADEVAAEELEQYREQQYAAIDDQLPAVWDRVAELLVLTEAGARYAQAHGVAVRDPAAGEVASQVGLPADNDYVSTLAEFLAVMNALQGQITPVAPSEADQREAFDNLRFQGQPVTDSFEDVQQFLTVASMGPQVGLRDLLLEVVAETDIVVNPRYDLVHTVPVQIGQATTALAVPLGEASEAVVDAARP